MPVNTYLTALRRLTRVARTQEGLFLVSQAEACGLNRRVLRELRMAGHVDRLNAHVYGIAGTPDSRRRRTLAALLAAGPRAVLSHTSAAWLHGLFDVRPDGIHLLFPNHVARRAVRGARIHTTRNFAPNDGCRHGPFRMTSIPRTICDLSGILDERHLRLVVHDAWRRGLTTPEGIAACLARLGPVSGARKLWGILHDCDPAILRTRSTWETEAFDLIRRASLPLPVVNLLLENPDGSPRYELDLAWPHLRFAYEVQSREYHTIRPDTLKDERKRRELEAEGWRIEQVPLDLIRHDPMAFVEKVRSDLAIARRASR